MTLTIGRLGFNISLDPSALQMTGSRSQLLRISGEISPATAAEATYLRDELYRMTESEVVVVPVTLSTDPTTDGFYEIVSSAIQVRVVSLSGWYPFAVNLARYGSDGRIGFESRLSGGLRANDHSILAGSEAPFHAVPAAATAYDPGATIPASITRVGDGASAAVYRDVALASDPLWSVPAGSFYNLAAAVESGATLRVLAGLDSENLPDDWRLGNGLLRITPNGTNGRIDVQHHDGTSWETVKTYQVLDGGAEVGQWDVFSVIRNDPAGCTIRLLRSVSGGGVVTLDLTLRRGSRYVECRINKGTSTTFKVVRSTTEAGTSFTSGIRATVNDGDGNRYILASSKTTTKDTTNGGLEKASVSTWDFMIGSIIAGASAQAGDQQADLVLQYHGYLVETMAPVKR